MNAREIQKDAEEKLVALRKMDVEPRRMDGRKTIKSCTFLDLLQHAAYLLEQMRDIDPETDTGRKRIKSLNVQAGLALRCAQL